MSTNTNKIPFQPMEILPIIDGHCHYGLDSSFKKGTLPFQQRYDDFLQHNGKYMIFSTIDSASLLETLPIIQKYQKTGLTVGWAPQTVTYTTNVTHDKQFQQWVEWVNKHPKDYLGIGEIGLDFHHAKTDYKRQRQIEVFRQIIQKTKLLNKPYILHVRNPAKNEQDIQTKNPSFNQPDAVNKIIMDVLTQEGISMKNVIWHCFSGPVEWGPTLSQRGCLLSVPSSAYGFTRWRKNTAEVSIESLLTETDSPFQHPTDISAYNFSTNVRYAVAAIAYSHKMEQEKVAEKIVQNFERFYSLSF